MWSQGKKTKTLLNLVVFCLCVFSPWFGRPWIVLVSAAQNFEMGVTRLRLARFGGRNRPFFKVVAIDSRKARDARPLEYVSMRSCEATHTPNTQPLNQTFATSAAVGLQLTNRYPIDGG